MDNLDQVEWKEGALHTLKHSYIGSSLPTLLFLRHSAREYSEDFKDDMNCQLTPIGRKVAQDFGTRLNPKKKYRIFHSPVQRCKDTGMLIQEGLQSIGGNVQFKDAVLSLVKFLGVQEGFPKYYKRDSMQVMNYWLANFYPSWEMEPSVHLVQRCILDCLKNLKECESGGVDIYVGHDLTVLVLLFHLGGILATDTWISYLDGFALQVLQEEKKLRILFGDREILAPFPHWWPANSLY